MNYKEKANYWLSCYGLDKKIKEEIKRYTDKELYDAFNEDLTFGTGGIRGMMGAGTNRINKYIIRKTALGFGRYLIKNVRKSLNKGVVISFDNRLKSKEFAYESACVLTSLGFKKVYLYHSLRPTPQLSWTIRHVKACGGIMITASHNPKEYNGFKAYNSTGCQLNLEESENVINEINNVDNIFKITVSKNIKNIHYIYDELDNEYLDDIKTISFNNELNKDFKIVYTPLHGTGGVYIPSFLKELGYNVYPLESQMIFDPLFSSTESSNPEMPEAFIKSITYGKEINASLLLATDPDADRLGCAVLHNDEYILLTGNELAAIIFDYICKQKKSIDPLWPKKKAYLFSTIVSSNLTNKIALKYNINKVDTLTGFKFIGELCEKLNSKEEFVFGFEESYGCLIKDSVRDKDSVQACLMTSEIAAYYYNQGRTLIDVLNDIYKEFGYYKTGIINMHIDINKINDIMTYFRETPINISNININSLEDYSTSKKIDYINNLEETLNLPKSNVLKFNLDNNSWFVLRPSGTEPKLKIYAEAYSNSLEESNNLLEYILESISNIINNL